MALPLIVLGCDATSDGDATDSYFPLTAGHVWTYNYTAAIEDRNITSFGPVTHDVAGTITWVVDEVVQTDRGFDFTINETLDATVHYVYPSRDAFVGTDTTYVIQVLTTRNGSIEDDLLEIEPISIGGRDTRRMVDNPPNNHRFTGGALESLTWQNPASSPDTVRFQFSTTEQGTTTSSNAQLVRDVGLVGYTFSRGPVLRSSISESMTLVSFVPGAGNR